MNITFTARHCLIPDAVRSRAETRLTRLNRYEPRLASADLIFEVDHGIHRIEARLYAASGSTVVATGAGEDFRAALDRAVSKVGRQLKRRRERRRDHQAVKLSEIASPLTGEE